MKKIPSLFKRNYELDRRVRDEVTEGCEWVLAGEGVATQKMDGTACMIRDGRLYKRYDCKRGRTPPPDFEPCEPTSDQHTGHWPGWVPVRKGPEDKWHREAFDWLEDWPDGTYELVGPKIQGNPEGATAHLLFAHDALAFVRQKAVPRDFVGIREFLSRHEIEGIVWHHPDGRMCKIKRKDFGLEWPIKRA